MHSAGRPVLTTRANCAQLRRQCAWCWAIARTLFALRRGQQSIQAGREGVAAAGLFEQPQRDEGIQQNGQGAQVALQRAGDVRSRQRRGGQGAERSSSAAAPSTAAPW